MCIRDSLKDGKSKVLTFSYDDGVVQDKRLMEIFDCHGLKGTFNINSGLYRPSDTDGSSGRMTKGSCLALYKNSNHEVAVHGFKHLWPAKISSVELLQEILEDRKAIEKDYGVIARGMAYAYGNYNAEVIDTLKKCGIVYSRGNRACAYVNRRQKSPCKYRRNFRQNHKGHRRCKCADTQKISQASECKILQGG